MKNLITSFVNFVLYILYVLVISVIFSFTFPYILDMLGREVLHPSDPVFSHIQIGIMIAVFIITVVFRKYFYLSLRFEESSKQPKKDEKVSKKASKKEEKVAEKIEEEEEEIKIYIDKEIK